MAFLAFRYIAMLVISGLTIGYAIGLQWAIFFVVAHFIMSMLSGSLITLLVSAIIVFGVLFHYELPWWYALLIGQNVSRFWEHISLQEKVRKGEIDELEALQRFRSFESMADILFWIATIGMLYQCYQRFFS